MVLTRFLSASIVLLLTMTLLPRPATGQTAAVVRVVPSAATVAVGDAFDVQLRADLGDPVLGWGLDLAFDPAIVSPSAAPTLGPLWASVFTADNDGLAGLAFPSAAAGCDVLLATLHFTARSLGQTNLVISTTPGDLTEGLPLDPTGFADVRFVPATITVAPEPCTLSLVALGVLAARRRSRKS